jgi:3-hydroxybutyryl-CoA dehydratase
VAIRVGDSASRRFVVDAATMRWFQEVAEDTSRIHCDRAFAQERGFTDVIVYGGILLAHLSHLLGMKIPGANGTSIGWSVKFHQPLYVDEEAEITLKVANVSAATGVVEGKFSIMSGQKKVATGTTQSIVPLDQIQA